MKKELTAQEIIELHVRSDEIIDIATIKSDYQTNNKEYKKREKLFTIVSKDLDLAMEVYGKLLVQPCIASKISAATECLKLNIYIDEAVAILEEISKRTDIGTRRLNAEMALRVSQNAGLSNTPAVTVSTPMA